MSRQLRRISESIENYHSQVAEIYVDNFKFTMTKFLEEARYATNLLWETREKVFTDIENLA